MVAFSLQLCNEVLYFVLMDGIRVCGTIPSYRRRTYQIKLHLYGAYPLVNATLRQISFLLLSFYYMKCPSASPWLCGFYFIRRPKRRNERSISMTREEKNAQIRREARATAILFCICFLWHVGCAYLLSGTGATVCGSVVLPQGRMRATASFRTILWADAPWEV